jgi:hypothetical protein
MYLCIYIYVYLYIYVNKLTLEVEAKRAVPRSEVSREPVPPKTGGPVNGSQGPVQGNLCIYIVYI